MLKCATINGAKTLGRNDLGSLEVGKGADLFMVDVEKMEFTGAVHDPKNFLPRVGATGPVYLTMINGKVVWKDGEFPGIDEAKLFAEGEAVCTKVIRSQSDAYQPFVF